MEPASTLTIQNGIQTHNKATVPIFPGQRVLYEVFRLESGFPVFLDDHLSRLYNGALKMDHLISHGQDEFKGILHDFIKASGAIAGNIRIEFVFSPGTRKEQFYQVFFVPTSYPTPLMYKQGVNCTLLEKERTNPSLKIANPDLRQTSDAVISNKNVYEAILCSNDVITEGSRSNLFFISGKELRTAPAGLVLEGIMRKKVLEIAQKLSIPVNYDPLPIQLLCMQDAAFITGTSPRVLPVRDIDSIEFQVPHPIIDSISREIYKMIEEEKGI